MAPVLIPPIRPPVLALRIRTSSTAAIPSTETTSKPPTMIGAIDRTLTVTTPLRRSKIFQQRGSAVADFLKRRFEATKFFRSQLGEDSLYVRGMFSKG